MSDPIEEKLYSQREMLFIAAISVALNKQPTSFTDEKIIWGYNKDDRKSVIYSIKLNVIIVDDLDDDIDDEDTFISRMTYYSIIGISACYDVKTNLYSW